MPDRPAGRRYPRTARVNEVVREVVAEELERLLDVDERLALLTVTHVEVSADLRRATVLLSSLPEGAEAALGEHRGRLQAAIGRQIRLKRTPQLSFEADPAIATGAKIEELLRGLDEPTRRDDGDH
jgi:ribosome-binding factor A